MESIGLRYVSDRFTVGLLSDDLYAGNPVCEHAREHGYSFIYVCKTAWHEYFYNRLAEFSGDDLYEKTYQHWMGKKRQLYRYRYRNGVPLRDHDYALQINWIELTIMGTDARVTRRFSFVTDLRLTVFWSCRSTDTHGPSRLSLMWTEATLRRTAAG